MKKLFVFDLDNTLTESKSAMTSSMAEVLNLLLTKAKVAIISGGDYPQFDQHVTPYIIKEKQNMFYLPTTGTKFYEFQDGNFVKKYSYDLSDLERRQLKKLFSEISKNLGIEKLFGEQIEDRGTQITFSALGQDAPSDLKKQWDPEQTKRKKIKDFLEKNTSGFYISINGGTSLNITKENMDKKFGMEKLRDILNLPFSEMIYFGDELDEHGNDYPIRSLDIDWIQVRDYLETENILRSILKVI